MSNFLKWLKASKSFVSPRVVTGNEAGDLDSTVSANALAYFLSLTKKDENAGLINIPKREFRLRTDIVKAMDEAFGKEATKLMETFTFADEIDLNKFKSLEMVLTDHNALAKSHQGLKDVKVRGIVDHHADQGLYKDSTDLVRIIDLECGSATSHVALMFKKDAASALESDEPLAKLLLMPILIDTINLKPELGRCFPVDVEAADYLYSIIKPGETKQEYFDKLFTLLQNAKFDVSSLSSDDLLRKDYKEIAVNGHNIGMSSVTWHFAGWTESVHSRGNNVGDEIVDFATKSNLDAELVMTAYEYSAPRGFARELAIAASPTCLPLLQGLEKDERMQMKPLTIGDLSRRMIKDWTLAVYEINPAFSRKKVLPIVQEIAGKLENKL